MNDNYSINLMWINPSKDENGEYVCSGRKTLDNELKQVQKWSSANPEAQVNFWYDSECTNANAIENTKKKLTEISDKVHLRDIREMPFVQDNSNLFLPSVPVYFRIDFLKLITCLHLMENEGHDSVIFADMSIAEKVEKALSKQELFNEMALKNLNEYGMLIGKDTWKPENQFLQTANTPELIASLKHAINCCSFLATNALNKAIKKQDSKDLKSLHNIPFTATMVYVYVHLLALKTKEPIKIRADMVNEGTKKQWVTYEPSKHGYLLFGNDARPYDLGSRFRKGDELIGLRDVIKLPKALKFKADINEFFGFDPAFQERVVREDLNPSKPGSGHEWIGDLPLPKEGNEFHCTFWQKKETKVEDDLKSYKGELDGLLKELEKTQELLSQSNSRGKRMANSVETLSQKLKTEMKDFFENEKPTVDQFKQYNDHCLAAIDNAYKETKNRGWDQVKVPLKRIVAVLAEITGLASKERVKTYLSKEKPEMSTAKKITEFKKQFEEQKNQFVDKENTLSQSIRKVP
jgi:hypothetical protein